jgi:hypothetical protein
VIPQANWPKGSNGVVGGPQKESWLDQSFFRQFKSKNYSTAGAQGNLAEESQHIPIGSDTSNPFGLWLATDYNSSIQADRVVQDTATGGRKKFGLQFADCSDGYSVRFPLLVPTGQDILTPDCQLLVTTLKDSGGNQWVVMYWIFAVDNTVGEMLFEAPLSTVNASNQNSNQFLGDGLNLAFAGAGQLYAATSTADPLPIAPPGRVRGMESVRLHHLFQSLLDSREHAPLAGVRIPVR